MKALKFNSLLHFTFNANQIGPKQIDEGKYDNKDESCQQEMTNYHSRIRKFVTQIAVIRAMISTKTSEKKEFLKF